LGRRVRGGEQGKRREREKDEGEVEKQRYPKRAGGEKRTGGERRSRRSKVRWKWRLE
jgi:hypothetical protein